MQVFVMISNVGIMVNADVNAKNWLKKLDVMMDFFWNSSICACECDKSCECLTYENYKCTEKLTDKLAEECSEDIDGNNVTLNDHGKVQVLHNIHSIIIHCIFNNHSSAFFLFPSVFKKR